MLIAGFDTETTGLNYEQDWIVEVGVVLWDTDAKHRKSKLCFESILAGAHLPAMPPEVTAIHGITDEDVKNYGNPAEFVLATVNSIFIRADAICAHNGNMFDRPMYEANLRRLGLPLVERPWIDTMSDVPFPVDCKERSLRSLAAYHQFLNPFPHAAASDVLTMLRIADQYDWHKTLEFAKAPCVVIRADVTFDTKELAKKMHFRWDAVQKIWTKSIKDFQLDAARKAAKDLGFKVTVLKGS